LLFMYFRFLPCVMTYLFHHFPGRFQIRFRSKFNFTTIINLFAEQDKHLSKVNTTTQIVVQVRLMLMKKLNLSDHIT